MYCSLFDIRTLELILSLIVTSLQVRGPLLWVTYDALRHQSLHICPGMSQLRQYRQTILSRLQIMSIRIFYRSFCWCTTKDRCWARHFFMVVKQRCFLWLQDGSYAAICTQKDTLPVVSRLGSECCFEETLKSCPGIAVILRRYGGCCLL